MRTATGRRSRPAASGAPSRRRSPPGSRRTTRRPRASRRRGASPNRTPPAPGDHEPPPFEPDGREGGVFTRSTRSLMTAISAKLVAELRERTGAGMMDCKRALEETGGDLAKAAELLRV